MQYSDAETSCVGRWDPGVKAFHGTVKQKVNSADKIFVAADPVTHTFDLFPCQHSEPHLNISPCTELNSSFCLSSSRHRVETSVALEDCFEKLYDMISVVKLNDVAETRDLCKYFREEVHWRKLLEKASHLAERCCAYIRLVAAYCDALDFTNPSECSRKFDLLKAIGISRFDMHCRCDAALSLVTKVLTWWYHFNPTQVESATAVHVARYRLEKSYEQFSVAFSSTTIRLTSASLNKYAMAANMAFQEQQAGV